MKKILPVFFLIWLFFLCKTSSVLAAVTLEETCEVTPESKTSRPTACYICNQNELMTPSCATSVKATRGVDYYLSDGPDFEIPWEGEINVNPVSADGKFKIPFVGLKNEEDENKYLADYFEGTNEYYRNYGNQSTLTNYQGVLRKLTPFEYQNQLKKQLISRAPKEGFSVENPIHDYEVVYVGRLCWTFPFWMEAGRLIFNEIVNLVTDKLANTFINKLKDNLINKPIAWLNNLFDAEIKKVPDVDINIDLKIANYGHYCLYADLKNNKGEWLIIKSLKFSHLIPGLGKLQEILALASQKIPGLVHLSSLSMLDTLSEPLTVIAEHLPPSPNEENYRENFLAWKKSGPESNKPEGYWYRLWQAVPMLTREDTQGEIIPYLANGNKETDTLEIIPQEATIASIPHLARLYEGSKIISDLLIPVGKEGKMVEMVKTPEIPITNPPYACFRESYTPPTGEGDDLCCGNPTLIIKAVDVFTDPGFYDNRCNCLPPNICNPPITLDEIGICGDKYTQAVSRYVGINLKEPYLDEIWSYTTNAKGGFFNIFRPYGVPAFEDIAAAQTLIYSSSVFNGQNEKGEKDLIPEQGLFFFPHLGGIQIAKEKVVNQFLWPYVQ